jgi:hypothetical protein
MTDYPRTPDRQTANATSVTPEEDVRTVALNRVSWGAVLAGVVVALVVQLLLSMLGLGIGVATLDPKTGDNPSAGTFSIAAGIWYVVAGIIAAYAGGYIAGRLSGRPVGSTAGLHGLTSWAVTTVVVFFLLTTAIGGVIGGVFSGISGALGGLGRAAVSGAQVAAPGLATAADPFGAIERQLRESSGGNDPAALRDAAVAAVRAALTGDQTQAQEARERAAQALAKAQNISIDEARNRVAQYEQQYRQTLEQTKQQAVQAAQTTAKVVSRGALFGFFALVLGAIAAWFGGRAGTVVPTITSMGFSASDGRSL